MKGWRAGAVRPLPDHRLAPEILRILRRLTMLRDMSLMFINKTTESMSLTNNRTSGSREIFRHVQLGRRKPRSQGAHWKRANSAPSSRHYHHRHQRQREGQPAVSASEESAILQVPDYGPHSPYNGFDAFGILPSNIKGQELEVLRFFLDYSLVSDLNASWSVEKQKARQQRFKCLQHANIHKAIRGDHLYALLAATTARMSHLPGCSGSRLASMRYLQLALQEHRSRFNSNENTILQARKILDDITLLATAAWYLGDLPAAMSMQRAIALCVHSLDLERMHDLIHFESLLLGDLFVHVELGTPTKFMPGSTRTPVSLYDFGPVRSLALKVIEHDRSSYDQYIAPEQRRNDFIRPETETILGPAMLKILESSHFSAWLSEVRNVTSLTGMGDRTFCSETTILVLAADLLALSGTAQGFNELSLFQCVQECCRLALLILIGNCTSTMAERAGVRNACRLYEVLRRAESRFPGVWLGSTMNEAWGNAFAGDSAVSTSLRELMLWSCLTAHYAMYPAKAAEDECIYLQACVRNLAAALKLVTFDQICSLACRFVYVGQHQDASLRAAMSLHTPPVLR